MANKSSAQQGWALLPSLKDRFPGAMQNLNYQLFGDDFLALVPEARPGVRPSM
jgi:hypothetical protein